MIVKKAIVRVANSVSLKNFGMDSKIKEYFNSLDSSGRFTIQHVILMPNSTFDAHMHSCEHFAYILRGGGKIWIWQKNKGKKVYALARGDFFAIPKLTPHSIIVGKEGLEKLAFNIPAVDARNKRRIIGISKEQLRKTWTQKRK